MPDDIRDKVTDDIKIICSDGFRRNFGGINFLNLSCLDKTPSKDAYFFASKFLGMIPQIREQISSSPESIRHSFEQVKGDFSKYMNHARDIASNPLSDPKQRESAIRVSQNDLWGIVYKVDNHVNNTVNYTRDIDASGKIAEIWQSPDETTLRKLGDCEDYAILKFALLQKLGFPADKLWLMVGMYHTYNPGGHAALLVEIENKHFVLNNGKGSKIVSLKDYIGEGRLFTPGLIMNDQEAFIVEDSKLQDISFGKQSGFLHSIKSIFSVDALKADWQRMTEKKNEAPQFDF